MAKTSDGGPAFPTWTPPLVKSDGETIEVVEGSQYHVPGMSLRDYFAAHAPEIPEHNKHSLRDSGWADWIDLNIIWRYEYADAMLAEREKPDA